MVAPPDLARRDGIGMRSKKVSTRVRLLLNAGGYRTFYGDHGNSCAISSEVIAKIAFVFWQVAAAPVIASAVSDVSPAAAWAGPCSGVSSANVFTGSSAINFACAIARSIALIVFYIKTNVSRVSFVCGSSVRRRR